ncbi:MAG: SDR family oxidoreductase, partial [Gammaproteobacteria bacterium]|nr:SDR family oxidoreductase [Gammaproteobacteria bacterium]
MSRLPHTDKVAVVTGAASGIGQAIAVRLARDGARVACLDLNAADETVARAKMVGGEVAAWHCDVTEPAAIDAAVSEVERRWGGPTILVHSAVYQFVRPFEQVSFDAWRRVQSVNIDALFHLSQRLLAGMRARRWGRILAIASSTFFVGADAMTHYVTSKGAVIGFVHGLAAEVGRDGITINALAPGLTRTPSAVADLPPEVFAQVARLQAIPRNGTPEDQAGVASFLVSDEAGF